MAEDTALSGSATGQDVSTTEGTATNGQAVNYNTTEDTTAPTLGIEGVSNDISQSVDFGSNYINNDTSTVAGQLGSLLASDSPYIQEARRSALEFSAGRGLQNTSIAAGSGEKAAIQSALPIATQDASTYAQSDLATQNATQALEGQKGTAIIEGALNEQNYSFQGTQNAFNRAHEIAVQTNNLEQQTAMKEMDQTHETIENDLNRLQQDKVLGSQQGHEEKMAGINAGYNETIQGMQTTSSELIAKNNLDYQESRDFQSATTTIMAEYQADVTSLLSDMNFLEASAGDITSTMQSLQNVTQNNIQFAGAMAGIPTDVMDSYLANAF